MKLFEILFLYSFITLGISCQNRNKININKSTIEKLSMGPDTLPSPYGNHPIFVVTENKKIAEFNNGNLRLIYRMYYTNKYKTLKSFVEDAVYQKIIIPKSRFVTPYIETFYLNKEIIKKYEDNSLDNFIVMFCRQYEDQLCLDRKKINAKEYSSVLYFLFINNYRIEFDDIVGSTCIYKW